MAALINALDTFTPTQVGENSHVEYTWSNDIQEKIIQFSFQLTRTKDKHQFLKLKTVLKEILTTLSGKASSVDREKGIEYLTIMYKLIGQTRDIIDGKGEYSLTYMMIYVWYFFYPNLALYAIKCLVDFGDNGKTHQYGSWKDIKYFCDYCISQNASVNHEMIKYSIQLINDQLRRDVNSQENLSLLARWVPREKSKFGWFYGELACDYFSHYLESAKTFDSIKKATLKCKMEYRKLLSNLNKKLDTLQIKQCDKRWAEIDFKNVTSISIAKQKRAFLNVTKEGSQRSEEEDRIQCANHFIERIKKAATGEIEIKGKRVGMESFTKEALKLLSQSEESLDENLQENLQTQINLLNSQWRDNSSMTGALTKMIAMVDVSGSMNGDPLHVAIALGIRVAEKSALGKRVLTFSAEPKWCNLENHDNFVDMVNVVKSSEWGLNTNFYAALKQILCAIEEKKLLPEDVENMVLVIFSDMEIDENGNSGLTMFKTIEQEYASLGIQLHGRPFKPPHILFWNLRSTDGFPCLSTVSNASMMSGFSPSLLNLFCEKGIDAFQDCSPWNIFLESLKNPRYNIMSDKIKEFFD
jgi:hypothetical protein